ncbi:hypothetical protein BXY66_0204 [Shimia isoporae]|uniref:Chalcone isomerase-like protein n=1 Tax=Shimia isoporae TaxID=647720 RepID=A0A4R1NKJ8_9RHOB|nr:hypothetical protein [Shimia isoporae]TCL08171.1 hypothetical protein BXY66_0204 [Shimia isoporae]
MARSITLRSKALIFALSALLPLGWAVQAIGETAPPEVTAVVPQPAVAGEGQFRYLGFKVYDLDLFTSGGKRFDADAPFALAIEYDRKIRSAVLLKASLGELERVEGKKADHDAIMGKLAACYRDIAPGDRIVAAPRGANAMSFWVNGTRTCTLNHPNFRDRYMAIWMSDRARDPAQARRLRGQG